MGRSPARPRQRRRWEGDVPGVVRAADGARRDGMGALEGQVAVVTGASRGIGAAIARELAHQGAHVVINYARSAKPAEVLTAQADVAVEEQARGLIEQAWERFGRLDMLVNNAGITRDKTIRKMTSD